MVSAVVFASGIQAFSLSAPEIIEDTNEVAIKIGGHKLAQLPRFVLGLGNYLRLRGLKSIGSETADAEPGVNGCQVSSHSLHPDNQIGIPRRYAASRERNLDSSRGLTGGYLEAHLPDARNWAGQRRDGGHRQRRRRRDNGG